MELEYLGQHVKSSIFYGLLFGRVLLSNLFKYLVMYVLVY